MIDGGKPTVDWYLGTQLQFAFNHSRKNLFFIMVELGLSLNVFINVDVTSPGIQIPWFSILPLWKRRTRQLL